MSEWPRRWTRNPLGSARRGSNPLAVVFLISVRPASAAIFQASACADTDAWQNAAHNKSSKAMWQQTGRHRLTKNMGGQVFTWHADTASETQHKQKPAQKLQLRSFCQPSILAAFLCTGCSAWFCLLCCQPGPVSRSSSARCGLVAKSRPCRLLPCREQPSTWGLGFTPLLQLRSL